MRTTALLVLVLCLAAALTPPCEPSRARLDGTYQGKPVPSPVFVTAIMVRQDGQWKERLYQITAVQP